MEVFCRNGWAGQPHPQCLPERHRRSNRHDLDIQALLRGYLSSQAPTLVWLRPLTPPPKDLPGIEVHVRRYPKIDPLHLLIKVPLKKRTDRKAVLVDGQHQHPWPQRVNNGKLRGARGDRLWPAGTDPGGNQCSMKPRPGPRTRIGFGASRAARHRIVGPCCVPLQLARRQICPGATAIVWSRGTSQNGHSDSTMLSVWMPCRRIREFGSPEPGSPQS